jgi:hypothetical protein
MVQVLGIGLRPPECNLMQEKINDCFARRFERLLGAALWWSLKQI